MSTRARLATARFFGWMLPALLAVGLLLPAIRGDVERARNESSLTTLAEALWSYREIHGEWPPTYPATAAELVPLLLEEGHLSAAPINPATKAPYGSDPFEIDRVWYGLEEESQVFVLELLDEEGSTVVAARRSSDAR